MEAQFENAIRTDPAVVGMKQEFTREGFPWDQSLDRAINAVKISKGHPFLDTAIKMVIVELKNQLQQCIIERGATMPATTTGGRIRKAVFGFLNRLKFW